MKNLCLFMVECFRWDHRHIFEEGIGIQPVKTIVQGTNTPTSFPSLLSGVARAGVRRFFGQKIQIPTVFDLAQRGYDVGYFDHPQDPVRRIFRFPPLKDLEDVVDSDQFVFVARETAPHTPYARAWYQFEELNEIGPHAIDEPGPREYPNLPGEMENGKEYIASMQRGMIDFKEDYRRGLEMALSRFEGYREILEENDRLEETFVVVTSDHGEVWGKHDGRPGNWIHNHTVPEVVHVPTFFCNGDVEVEEPLMSKDIVRKWIPSWDEIREELTVISNLSKEESEQDIKERLKALGYM